MSLVALEFLLRTVQCNGLVAPRVGDGGSHRLSKKLKSLNLVNGFSGTLWVVKNNESLPLGLDILLGHNIRHGTKFGEDGSQGIVELL